MPSKNPAQRLRDIIDNIDAIGAFTAGMAFDDFVRDRKTVYAVTRALEIVSEASRRLPDDLKNRYPSVDWQGCGLGWQRVPARVRSCGQCSGLVHRATWAGRVARGLEGR